MKDFLGCVGALVLVTVALVFGAIFNGYALSVLWGWFIVPTFSSMPNLSVVSAIGIAMVVAYLTYQTAPDVEEKQRETGIFRMIAILALRPALALFFGWIVHFFM